MSVVVAILVKNKEIFLPLYLSCLYKQTYNKKNMHLYIRTNDNTDQSIPLLKSFIEKYGHEYGSVYYKDDPICENLKNYKAHEWNYERFRILAKIRQESIEYAKKMQADYFVVDCDNFIIPETLEKMYKLRELGVISPMLRTNFNYSNFHYDVNSNGYYITHPDYMDVRYRNKKGVFIVKVVHCVYFIHKQHLTDITYTDGTDRHEYVIFSDHLRKKEIGQYLDNREEYGLITFAETKEEFDKYLIETHFTTPVSITL